MNTHEIDDKAHKMNPLVYKEAQIILESFDEEVLHEIVVTVINVLSYNASWNFRVENQEDTYFIYAFFGGCSAFINCACLHNNTTHKAENE